MEKKPQSDFQLFTGIGRLTRDVERRVTPSGKTVVNFSVAINQRDGSTLFLDCENWPNGEAGATDRLKGDQVLVEGKLIMSEWNDRNTGEKRQKLKVRAHSVQLLAEPMARKPSQPSEPPRSFGVNPPPRRDPPSRYGSDNLDEDVPFL